MSNITNQFTDNARQVITPVFDLTDELAGAATAAQEREAGFRGELGGFGVADILPEGNVNHWVAASGMAGDLDGAGNTVDERHSSAQKSNESARLNRERKKREKVAANQAFRDATERTKKAVFAQLKRTAYRMGSLMTAFAKARDAAFTARRTLGDYVKPQNLMPGTEDYKASMKRRPLKSLPLDGKKPQQPTATHA